MHQKAFVLFMFCCVAGSATIPSLTAPTQARCPAGDQEVGLPLRAVSIAQSQEKSASAPNAVVPNSPIIAIPIDGEFYLDKVRVAEADLLEKIRQALKDKASDQQIVYVKAASVVTYGAVVSVIDALRRAGFDRIGLLAEKNRHDVKPSIPATNTSGLGAAHSSPPSLLILIEVKNKTRVELNSKPMLLSGLRSRLQKLLDSQGDKTIFIRAPRKMNYGDVVKVIDIAKSAGAQPIGLQVDHLQRSYAHN